MIVVMYSYFNKSKQTWIEGETEFTSCVKALRFMYSIKGKNNYVLEGYSCDDPYDTEYIERRISIT